MNGGEYTATSATGEKLPGLKDCPFCGNPDVLPCCVGLHFIGCPRCGAEGPSHEDRFVAARGWNYRHRRCQANGCGRIKADGGPVCGEKCWQRRELPPTLAPVAPRKREETIPGSSDHGQPITPPGPPQGGTR